MGQRSPIFDSESEQVLKEISGKDMTDYEKLAPKFRTNCGYEDEVCFEASINEVSEVVDSIKTDRAAGVDKVHSTMLKSASHGFLVRLTAMIIECLGSGYVPSFADWEDDFN